MTAIASDILVRAEKLILDETGVRWPLIELLDWLNDAQREIVLQLPSSLSTNTTMALIAGTYQQVPPQYVSMLRVIRNITAMGPPRVGGRVVRVVAREVLDTQSPDWHNPAITLPSPLVKHFVYDEEDQMSFYVWPPNDGTGVIECVFAQRPTILAIAVGADPNSLASYTMPLSISDIYANAILDYVLFRAFSKDADFAGNTQRAVAHYTLFANSIGMKIKTIDITSPNTAQAGPAPTNVGAR